MKKIILLGILLLFNISCVSNKLVQQYKNPDIGFFHANKVLIISLNTNTESRQITENSIEKALKNQGVFVEKSIDFLNTPFIKKEISKTEFQKIEDDLLKNDFDAILVTKIIGRQKRYHTTSLLYQYMKSNQTFEEYYYGNQYNYMIEKGKKEDYVILVFETSLYCICPDKERELIWKGQFEIKDQDNMEKNINKLKKQLINSLKNNDLLIEH
ncbi:hypothetical protein ACSIGC_02085 [Tenacibaculum sp. ZS6-P6]|uniref:hypothetical protein n=1 Tax=Tenacibaculum sp. ZS6-P6 TaxID=3447503 RepID=UPI003F967272